MWKEGRTDDKEGGGKCRQNLKHAIWREMDKKREEKEGERKGKTRKQEDWTTSKAIIHTVDKL